MPPLSTSTCLEITPFLSEDVPLLWNWLQEYPQAHFDDDGPKNLAEFTDQVASRLQAGEYLWAVHKDGRLSGAIGYVLVNSSAVMLHGITFPRGRMTRIEKRTAVAHVLRGLFFNGIEKVSATYFADNKKIDRFLKDLGAVEEGFLRRQTRRDGVPADLRLIAIFKENFQCPSRLSA